jgi:Leucine-rich repeat (LRR) protein
MSHNPLIGMADEAFNGQLESLTYLGLIATNTAKIPVAVTKLKNLAKLNLQRNPITFLSDDDLRNASMLGSLHDLYMDRCQLTSIPPAFNLLSELQYLSLPYNKIAKIGGHDFIGLTRLTHLGLAGNPILTIASHAFDSLGSLSLLNIGSIAMTTIPDAVQHLPRLSTLVLNWRHLECSCDDKWLVKWTTGHFRTIRFSSCSNYNNTSVPDFIAHVLPHCH